MTSSSLLSWVSIMLKSVHYQLVGIWQLIIRSVSKGCALQHRFKCKCQLDKESSFQDSPTSSFPYSATSSYLDSATSKVFPNQQVVRLGPILYNTTDADFGNIRVTAPPLSSAWLETNTTFPQIQARPFSTKKTEYAAFNLQAKRNQNRYQIAGPLSH